ATRPASSPTCPSTGPRSAPSSPSSTAHATCPTGRPSASRTRTALRGWGRRPRRPRRMCGAGRPRGG
ncbi:hypothetical protein KEM52_004122, partial [Ascosphaera acerosa]